MEKDRKRAALVRQKVDKLSANDLEWVSAGTPGVFEKVLNEDQVTGARTVMLKSQAQGYEGFFEVLVLDGEVEFINQAVLSTHDYTFLLAGVPVQLIGLEAISILLVNYSGPDTFSHFARATFE